MLQVILIGIHSVLKLLLRLLSFSVSLLILFFDSRILDKLQLETMINSLVAIISMR